MSFILDALKKSESDRQRQSGPALFEVKVASPRSRLPLWAIAIAALLAVNLGIVIWMLMRHSARAAAEASASAAAPAGVASTVVARAPAPAAAAAVPAAPVPTASVAPMPAPVPAVATPAAAPALPGPNPDDYAPAQESAGPSRLGGHVERGTASGVPLYQDAAAASAVQIPQLRLDLHVFAARAGERFVMINMHKLREGDVLPEGVRVESITPEGAVLTYNGTRFLLPRD